MSSPSESTSSTVAIVLNENDEGRVMHACHAPLYAVQTSLSLESLLYSSIQTFMSSVSNELRTSDGSSSMLLYAM